jgi:recombination protein RecA
MDGAAETIELPEVNAGDRARVARKKNLDLALAQIAKDFGEGAIMRLGDNHVSPVEVIPTGNILIDRALGDVL